MSDNPHTPEPWYYEPPDSGDSSVGMPATPPMVCADINDGEDTITVAELVTPTYSVPRDQWSAAEQYRADHPEEDFGDFPPGTRLSGSAEANGERIALCANFCAGYTDHDLEIFGSLRQVRAFSDMSPMLRIEYRPHKTNDWERLPERFTSKDILPELRKREEAMGSALEFQIVCQFQEHQRVIDPVVFELISPPPRE